MWCPFVQHRRRQQRKQPHSRCFESTDVCWPSLQLPLWPQQEHTLVGVTGEGVGAAGCRA